MRVVIAIALLLTAVRGLGEEAQSADEGLYYAAEQNLTTDAKWEFRLAAGHDFSNSFVAIYGFQAGIFYLSDSSVSFGLEGTVFLSSKKGTGAAFADEMEKLGYQMHALAPRAKAAGVIRVTPLSGMVNFFSSKIVKMDLSLLLRMGAIQYQVVGWGPSFGVGIETTVGLTKTVGINLAFHYETERPGQSAWLWRGGFLLGPTIRF